jgi:hypothetical protein
VTRSHGSDSTSRNATGALSPPTTQRASRATEAAVATAANSAQNWQANAPSTIRARISISCMNAASTNDGSAE